MVATGLQSKTKTRSRLCKRIYHLVCQTELTKLILAFLKTLPVVMSVWLTENMDAPVVDGY